MFRIVRICLLASIVFSAIGAANDELNILEADDGVTIQEGAKPVLWYQRSVKSLDGQWPRANYVHPLYDLDGNVITEDFPEDHRHHRGVFWAWHQVRVGEQKLGDSWICKRFIWDVKSVETTATDGGPSIVATVQWKSPDFVDEKGKPISVVREQTKISVHPRTNDYRLVDFQIELSALVDDVSIGGSEDVKGYGGFSPRIVLNDDQKFFSDSGELQPVKTAIEAGPWINISDGQRGLAVLASSANPSPNRRWILRRKRSMQNAVYPGREPVTLSQDEPAILKYRLVIHRGDLSRDDLVKLQTAYDGSPVEER